MTSTVVTLPLIPPPHPTTAPLIPSMLQSFFSFLPRCRTELSYRTVNRSVSESQHFSSGPLTFLYYPQPPSVNPGQPHPKRSMIHFSTPARINLGGGCRCVVEEEECGMKQNTIKSHYLSHFKHSTLFIIAYNKTKARNAIKTMSCRRHRDPYL